MKTRVRKWGNSLAVRIPKPIAEEIAITADSEVDMVTIDGKLIIEPTEESELTLEDLLNQITEENIHAEIDTGPAVGNEVW
ncbi:MAG: AbrB/MazE/SpoVT family DNA-binding domain-containing protein [Chloroflexi bacterium]|nr:AbrB/MazE/SpoVT family DNA-binding domain-containing protein [Chloroflexota bacterium]